MYILISGGFDPLHSGHLRAFEEASKIGRLVVAVNSDNWLIRKKKSFLLPSWERANLIRQLKSVYGVLDDWDDSDGTACDAIQFFYSEYKHTNQPLIFANGGDRTAVGSNAAENAVCESLGIYTMYGLGGGKTASSSDYLASYIKRISDNA